MGSADVTLFAKWRLNVNYYVRPDGTVRGLDTIWDKGAYEF